MATPTVEQTGAPAPDLIPTFQAFSWTNSRSRAANFASRTRSVVCGVQLVLEIIEADSIADDVGNRPFFNGAHHGVMLRLAIGALDLLGDASERECDQIERTEVRAR